MSSSIRTLGTQIIKELVWAYLSKHERGTRRDICLYASRRSGSTLLMEVIAANRGVTYSDQPFGAYGSSPAQRQALPVFDRGQVISLDAEEREMVRRYLLAVFSGELRVNAPWRFWRYGGVIRSNRIILKIVDAKAIADWIHSEFDVHTIYMTRHPIPQALSVIRNGWGNTGKAYLRNDSFVSRYLGEEELSFCLSVYRDGSPLARGVCDWALENLHLLRLLPKHPEWVFVSYEELVLHPDAVVERLCKAVELEDPEAMLRRVLRPSKSTRLASAPETKRQIGQRNADYLVGRWKSQVVSMEEDQAMSVLDVLGIGIYKRGSLLPDLSAAGRE